jgi:GTPase
MMSSMNPDSDREAIPNGEIPDGEISGGAIVDFNEIQSELNYRQAQVALQDLVAGVDLTDLERSGLEQSIAGLTSMLEKLDQSVIHIAAFGMVGRGKSSLLNALLGRNAFRTGAIHGVTQTEQLADWDRLYPNLGATSGAHSIVNHVQLIDTPGIDEVEGEDRAALAQLIAARSDLLMFVVSGDMTQVEHRALSALRAVGKPMILVFNKIDQYPDTDRQSIYEKIRDDRVKTLLSPDEIVMASAAPLVPIATRQADGRLKVVMEVGPPQVDAVKLKILEILDREGKALVALNSMLYADEVNGQIVERKLKIRDRAADQVIWNGVMTKAIAVAVNPITVLDVVSSAVVDVAVILTLSKLYGIAMTEKGAVSLLKNIAIAMGGITASELLATLGLGTLKSLLGASAPVTGGLSLAPYLSIAVTQAGVAGVSTYGIGQVAKVYFANGASWGEAGPKAVVTRILDSLDETSILARIKEELRGRLRSSPKS